MTLEFLVGDKGWAVRSNNENGATFVLGNDTTVEIEYRTTAPPQIPCLRPENYVLVTVQRDQETYTSVTDTRSLPKETRDYVLARMYDDTFEGNLQTVREQLDTIATGTNGNETHQYNPEAFRELPYAWHIFGHSSHDGKAGQETLFAVTLRKKRESETGFEADGFAIGVYIEKRSDDYRVVAVGNEREREDTRYLFIQDHKVLDQLWEWRHDEIREGRNNTAYPDEQEFYEELRLFLDDYMTMEEATFAAKYQENNPEYTDAKGRDQRMPATIVVREIENPLAT
jgi:hypothetical protein